MLRRLQMASVQVFQAPRQSRTYWGLLMDTLNDFLAVWGLYRDGCGIDCDPLAIV